MFDLVAPFKPAGNQPQAITKLNDSILSGAKLQTLRGAFGLSPERWREALQENSPPPPPTTP